mmetsp:Transcript_52788/g.78259  ORF Transcript_52788/g.78259 Transcript_52788/m.78259 type:complete len:146 (+) Transcript_52788:75-512(+)
MLSFSQYLGDMFLDKNKNHNIMYVSTDTTSTFGSKMFLEFKNIQSLMDRFHQSVPRAFLNRFHACLFRFLRFTSDLNVGTRERSVLRNDRYHKQSYHSFTRKNRLYRPMQTQIIFFFPFATQKSQRDKEAWSNVPVKYPALTVND